MPAALPKRVSHHEETFSTFLRNRSVFTQVDIFMKSVLAFLLLCGIVLMASCTKKPITEGRIVYSIDYPEQKDNFFLYSILPKEMEMHFKDGRLSSTIQKANLRFSQYVDCNQRSFTTYFEYGYDQFHSVFTSQEVSSLVNSQDNYTIQWSKEKDTIAGYDVKKAVAVNKENPKDKIELWYTEQIHLPEANWYNPFKQVKGTLLAYAIDRYGIRMVFRAKKVEEIPVDERTLEPVKKGKSINYDAFNTKMNDLFKTFE